MENLSLTNSRDLIGTHQIYTSLTIMIHRGLFQRKGSVSQKLVISIFIVYVYTGYATTCNRIDRFIVDDHAHAI